MLLSTQNVSNVAEVDFTSLVSNAYNNYKIVFDSAVSIGSSTNAYLTVQLSDDNGMTYQNDNYINYLGGGVTSGLAFGLLYDGGGLVPYTTSGEFTIHNLLSGTSFVSAEGLATFFDQDPLVLALAGQEHHGVYNGNSLSVSAIRIVSSDGQNISGNFYLYGY
jgi:hypothetical protein